MDTSCLYCHRSKSWYDLEYTFQNTRVRLCRTCYGRLTQTNVRLFVEAAVTKGPEGINEMLAKLKDAEWIKGV